LIEDQRKRDLSVKVVPPVSARGSQCGVAGGGTVPGDYGCGAVRLTPQGHGPNHSRRFPGSSPDRCRIRRTIEGPKPGASLLLRACRFPHGEGLAGIEPHCYRALARGPYGGDGKVFAALDNRPRACWRPAYCWLRSGTAEHPRQMSPGSHADPLASGTRLRPRERRFHLAGDQRRCFAVQRTARPEKMGLV